MKIGVIGNYQRSYSGELADEVHLAREIENLGHVVYRIPRDEWREHVIQHLDYKNVPNDVTLDAVLIFKWHHFYDGSFAERAREKYGCPVFYWVWDFMANPDLPDWHKKMIMGSDLYLGNDIFNYPFGEIPSQKLYYFPFDVADKTYDKALNLLKQYPVAFFGSYMGAGDRVEWLRKINEKHHVSIFASNPEDWKKAGFDAESAVYEYDLVRKMAESVIVLGFNVNDHTWGYWSNRVGKTLTLGAFLLQRYVPGMELFLRDGVEYFSSPEEAIEKIEYYLQHEKERDIIARRGYQLGRDRFTSEDRVKELMILIERFKKGAFLR
jgi:hypothetical protein